MPDLLVSDVRFTAASPTGVASGLLGWASCTLNDSLRLDGIAVRRKADGGLALSYPARRDAVGRQHYYIRPLDDAARREVEHQLLSAIGLEDGLRRG